MKVLKKLVPAIFLLIIGLIAFRFLCFTAYLEFQKADFRTQLINSKEAHVLQLKFKAGDIFNDKDGYEWKENNNELVINGNYYEVVSVTKVKDTYTVKIISDAAEDTLFQTYFSLNNDVNKGYTDLIKLLLDLNCIDENYYDLLNHDLTRSHSKIYASIQFIESSHFLKQIKPPQLA